ncbi:MAG: NAD-dependent epimerase/dehydratase family protein [Candidatus Eisenbacteria bacterium]
MGSSFGKPSPQIAADSASMGPVDLTRLGRCLITGATGEIGSRCVRRLNEAGIRPLVLLRSPLPQTAWRGAQVDILEGDLEEIVANPPSASPAGSRPGGTDPARGWPEVGPDPGGSLPETDSGLCRALQGVDTVLHLAARVNLSGRGAAEMERINDRAAVALFDLARACRVRRYVHVSTTAAVGCAATQVALDETATFNLERFDNPYFRTKRCAQEAILDHWRRGDGPTELVIVNPSITIGPQVSFRRLSLPRRPPFPKPGAAWLKCLRFWWAGGVNLVDARDVAEGILLAALRGRAGSRYILAGENVTFRDLMLRLQRIFGTGHPTIRVPLPILRASAVGLQGWARLRRKRSRWNPTLARLLGPYWFYDSALARRELGYAPRPLDETLRDIRAWWLEQARD